MPGGLLGALYALRDSATAAINAANVRGKGQIGRGSPFGYDLASLLQQNGWNWAGTVYPVGRPRDATRHKPETQTVSLPAVTLTASISGAVITFGGTPTAGDTVHAFVDAPNPDAFYVVQANDTLATIATAIALAITNLGASGISASASGAAVTVTGSKAIRINIGGSAIASIIEVALRQQDLQLSLWAPDPYTRESLYLAVEQSVGTALQPFVTLGDGSAMYCSYAGTSGWSDDSQATYTLYEAHMIFAVEYMVNQSVTATQIESASATMTFGDASPETAYTPGS